MDPARPPDRLPDDSMQCEPRAKSCTNGIARVERGSVSRSAEMRLRSRGSDAGSLGIVADASGAVARTAHPRLRLTVADRELPDASQTIVGPDDARNGLVSRTAGSSAQSIGRKSDTGDVATTAIGKMPATRDSARHTHGPAAPTRRPVPPAHRPRARSHDPTRASNAE
jgi:hypothetical protein